METEVVWEPSFVGSFVELVERGATHGTSVSTRSVRESWLQCVGGQRSLGMESWERWDVEQWFES